MKRIVWPCGVLAFFALGAVVITGCSSYGSLHPNRSKAVVEIIFSNLDLTPVEVQGEIVDPEIELVSSERTRYYFVHQVEPGVTEVQWVVNGKPFRFLIDASIVRDAASEETSDFYLLVFPAFETAPDYLNVQPLEEGTLVKEGNYMNEDVLVFAYRAWTVEHAKKMELENKASGIPPLPGER
ncbi:MAG: hypothetical protein ACK4P3_04665 [Fimbriimonadaceae bacterium]